MIVALALGWVALGSSLGAGFSDLLPLVVAVLLLVHVGARGRPLGAAFAPDTRSFAHRWPGKVLVAVVLIAIPVAMAFQSFIAGRYSDDSWSVLLLVIVLTGGYAASRRLLAAVLTAGVLVSVTLWVLTPHLATARNGDPRLLSLLDHQHDSDMLVGLHHVAVATVDLDSAQPVTYAGLGADATTPMEVGSLTKALTGLVIADAARRGEVRMDVPVSTYLPLTGGTPAGTVTMRELVTHTSGYVEFGAATLRRAAWKAPIGENFLNTDSGQMNREIRSGTLSTRGRYAYSTLGAATAGQAVAAAVGMSYPELMRIRLFAPLGMNDTAIQSGQALVPRGRSTTGLPVQPWVFDAYAPGGAAVSTTGDLAKLATALLDGTAPGLTALDPTMGTDQSNSRIGDFWRVSTWQTGQTITWHNGQTGGYYSYFGLDRSHKSAVIVLSDVANPNTDYVGMDLLALRD